MATITDIENLLLELATTRNLLQGNLDEARKKLKTATGEEKTRLQNQIRGLEKRIGDVKQVYRATENNLKERRKNQGSGGSGIA